jgi:hypothetical protein
MGMVKNRMEELLPGLKAIQEDAGPELWADFVEFFADALEIDDCPEDASPELLVEWLADSSEGWRKGTGEILQGSSIGGQTVYPLAMYGWDGGNGIESKLWNLVELGKTDLMGGPIAVICGLADSSFSGCAVHVGQDFVHVQLFV